MRTWTITVQERDHNDIEGIVLHVAEELTTKTGVHAVAVTVDDYFDGRKVVYNEDGVG